MLTLPYHQHCLSTFQEYNLLKRRFSFSFVTKLAPCSGSNTSRLFIWLTLPSVMEISGYPPPCALLWREFEGAELKL